MHKETDPVVAMKAIVILVKGFIEKIFFSLKKKGIITARIQADYDLFMQKVDEVCDRGPLNFSMKTVFVELHDNEWMLLYIEVVSKIPRQKSTGKAYDLMYESSYFQDICQSIRGTSSSTKH